MVLLVVKRVTLLKPIAKTVRCDFIRFPDRVLLVWDALLVVL